MYLGLPEKADEGPHRHPNAGRPVTHGIANYMLDSAMSRFDARPEREELEEIAKEQGDRFPRLGLSLLAGYEELDRMEGHLIAWTDGLFEWSDQQREREKKAASENAAEGG